MHRDSYEIRRKTFFCSLAVFTLIFFSHIKLANELYCRPTLYVSVCPSPFFFFCCLIVKCFASLDRFLVIIQSWFFYFVLNRFFLFAFILMDFIVHWRWFHFVKEETVNVNLCTAQLVTKENSYSFSTIVTETEVCSTNKYKGWHINSLFFDKVKPPRTLYT